MNRIHVYVTRRTAPGFDLRPTKIVRINVKQLSHDDERIMTIMAQITIASDSCTQTCVDTIGDNAACLVPEAAVNLDGRHGGESVPVKEYRR